MESGCHGDSPRELVVPPGLTLLSENIFRATDRLLVPVIPSPLSIRTLIQIKRHFADEERDLKMLTPFLSQVDLRKKVHREAAEQMLKLPGTLKTMVPVMAEIERMGSAGIPASRLHGRSRQVFGSLWDEISRLSQGL